MKNFRLLGLVALLVLSIGGTKAQNSQPNQHKLEIVKRLVAQTRAGFTLAYDYKQNVQFGDRVAEALRKVFTDDELVKAETLRACLIVMRRAFELPNWIGDPHDRSPQATLALLDSIRERTSEPELRVLISDYRQNIEKLTSQDPPNYRVGAITSSNLSMKDLLGQIATTYQVPIGFEDIPDKSPDSTIQLRFAGGTVIELMDELCAKNPQYRWGIVEGLIFIAPAEATASPLECAVFKFAVQNATAADTVNRLSELSEVTSGLAKFGIRHVEAKQLPEGKRHLMNLNFDGLRLHQILSRIVTGRTWFWAAHRHDSTLTITF